ncbi:MAG: Mut7-C RNAse domain-containing protein [Acidobacteriota bacterium]|nr:MAG: Mut7-C RNAse domain-containing protein [Acidobacteriota bacterium]
MSSREVMTLTDGNPSTIPSDPLDGPRFIADVMLGRLARWLRLIGLDVRYDNRWDDRTIVRLAVREERVVLTRDHELLGSLARRAASEGLLIDSDRLAEQLRQVLDAFRIEPERLRPFRRCSSCNEIVEPVARELLQGRVPPYVLRTQRRFSRCPACARVYWAGTHHGLVLRHLRRLLGEDDDTGGGGQKLDGNEGEP